MGWLRKEYYVRESRQAGGREIKLGDTFAWQKLYFGYVATYGDIL